MAQMNKLQMTTYICSDHYDEFRLNSVHFVSRGRVIHASNLSMFPLTQEERVHLATLADELTLKTVEGAEYKLNRIFGTGDQKSKSTFGPPPGTVRVFSRKHISFYDGKNWKKLNLPG